MRLLFLTSRLPFPPNRGDRLRTYHLLRQLSQEHELTLVSFVTSREEAAMGKELAAYCKEMHFVVRPKIQSVAATIGSAWRRQPLQSLYYRSAKMQRLVDRLLAGEKYEAAYVHLFRMAPYVTEHPGLYRIVDLTDVISSEIAASLPYRSWTSRLLYRTELRRIADYECRVAGWAEESWLISERDKMKLAESCPQSNLKWIPNGVDLTTFYPAKDVSTAHNLLFVGHMGVFHNVDAVEYLVNEILPEVQRVIPDCTLNIVGAGMSPQIRALEKNAGVYVLGFVPDLNRQLNHSAVFVAPLRFSAGVQNKVLEAMAAGTAVVTTSNVNDGLGAQPGKDLLVGDAPDELAAKIVTLLLDEAMRRQIGDAGRRFVEQRFSWRVAVLRLKQIEQLLSNGGDSRKEEDR